jgi:hypothetical protein
MSLSEGLISLQGEILPSDPLLSRACRADFSGAGYGHERPDVSNPLRGRRRTAGDRGPLERLSSASGVHAFDLGFQAADFVLEFEDAFDACDVDSGVGQGGDLA